MNFTKAINNASGLLFQGLQITVTVSLISILIGTVIGFCSCLLGLSKWRGLRLISKFYIWVIRGTPMIVQAFIVYFGLPQLVHQLISPDFRISAFSAGVVTLSLNAGAYLSEIFRGGISAVDKGQIEAARSLGMSSMRTMARVTLPQATKIAIPSMVNQFIITIKDTSILSVIGLADIVNKAKVYVGGTYQFFETYILVAVFYLVIISILMFVSNKIEKRFNYDKKKG
ncbi:MAG: amino acid ABC transporter permease [Oscillospiraceae bacterium]|jgi:His/Glu/Gln/Arg/opine family amino acid ABC transporter permease subunit|nr:amino acid ABC transporter permease [Oscillospiraceae bacterium]